MGGRGPKFVKERYSALDRLLHRLVLGSHAIRSLTYDLNRIVSPTVPENFTDRKHIFVSGLARSGTSILLRCLFGSQQFATLTYRHMPFVLAPDLWVKASRKFQIESVASERAHGDGLSVDFDTPEAFEEIFWLTFSLRSYVAEESLYLQDSDDINQDTIEKFVGFVSNVVSSNNKALGVARYLSKNNNNVLRLGALRRAFPSACLLVPFREPLSHAQSLLSQQERFSKIQAQDPYVLRYMNWLGHHEFGLNHKPFRFPGSKKLKGADKYHIDYWLAYWIIVYRYLLEKSPKGTIFVNYDLLCRYPEHSLHSLARKIEIHHAHLDPTVFIEKKGSRPSHYNEALLAEAELLHQHLVQLSA